MKATYRQRETHTVAVMAYKQGKDTLFSVNISTATWVTGTSQQQQNPMLSDIPTTDVYYTLLYKKFPGLGCFFVVPDVGFFKARMIRDKNSYVKIL